jgi:hypothetical protein
VTSSNWFVRSAGQPLLIRESDVDSIRDRVLRARLDDLRAEPDAFTLGAILELACCWVAVTARRRTS